MLRAENTFLSAKIIAPTGELSSYATVRMIRRLSAPGPLQRSAEAFARALSEAVGPSNNAAD